MEKQKLDSIASKLEEAKKLIGEVQKLINEERQSDAKTDDPALKKNSERTWTTAHQEIGRIIGENSEGQGQEGGLNGSTSDNTSSRNISVCRAGG